MSTRYSAWIRIGGQVDRSKLSPLLEAIATSYGSLDWGDAPFKPTDAEELLSSRQGDWLWFCDMEARDGEFAEIEEACRRFDLSYTRHTEAGPDSEAELVDWRPGMDKPVIQIGSNVDGERVLVERDSVAKALESLEAGRVDDGIALLKDLCPRLPPIPPFQIT